MTCTIINRISWDIISLRPFCVNDVLLQPGTIIHASQDMHERLWNGTIQTNVTGMFYTCREMVRRLLAAGKTGRIVNVSSTAVYLGSTTG